MRVLIVAPNEGTGGVESYIANTLAGMELENNDILIDIFLVGRNPEHHFSAMWNKCANAVYGPSTQESRLQRERRLYRTIQNHRYDIVHAHLSMCAQTMLYAKLLGVPHRMVQSHIEIPSGISADSQMQDMKRWLRRKIILHCATDFLACSTAAAEYMFGKKAAEHTVIARNGIDTKKFRFREEERTRRRKELSVENRFLIGTRFPKM